MAYDLLTKKTSPRNFSLCAGDPLVWTPGAVSSEKQRVLVLLDAANAEASQVVADKKITPTEWDLWHQTYVTIHAFLRKASSLWGSNALVAQSYEREVAKWRAFFLARGGKTVGPEGLGRKKDEPLVSLPTTILLVGGLAGAGLLISAIKKK